MAGFATNDNTALTYFLKGAQTTRLTFFIFLAVSSSTDHILAQTYFDNFEAPTFNSSWAIDGNVTLSTTIAHSGTQSVKLTGSQGYLTPLKLYLQYYAQLSRSFPLGSDGTFSTWVYDDGSGQANATLLLGNSFNQGEWLEISTGEGASCYIAAFQTNSQDIRSDSNCNDNPQLGVSRSIGWHQFAISVSSSATIFAIDGMTVLSVPLHFTSDNVVLRASSTTFSSGGAVYFDDFQSSITTPPSCQLSAIVPGPPTRLMVTMQDRTFGLSQIQVVESINASVSVPSFMLGTSTVIATAVKLDQAQSSNVGFVVTNTALVTTSCDPVDFRMVLDGAREQHVFRGLPSSEHFVRIVNGTPGVHDIAFVVNGRKFSVPDLQDGESYSLDIGSAMFPDAPQTGAGQRSLRRGTGTGNNYVTAEATGVRGSSVYILVGDASVQ